ncbi:MAG TPA: hypothetical protein VHD87_10630, partial [Acidimicrobiales bacterium]|nr:hypothetical protein [Acidimicrobiales bacterium]
GRAQPVIVAVIATILTANVAILSASASAPTPATNTAQPNSARVVFGTTDTPVGRPTAFTVRTDGRGLAPSASTASPVDPKTRTVWSHDGTHIAAVRQAPTGDELWVASIDGGDPRLVARRAPVRATYCGVTAVIRARMAEPVWSPDDRQIAFLANTNHLKTFGRSFDVMVANADGTGTTTLYRTPTETCERVDATRSVAQASEFVSLIGWQKSANMAA